MTVPPGSRVATGAAIGASTYHVIGGIGIAAIGTAVGVTLGPFIGIGAGVGLGGYSLYWLGKQIEGKKAKKTSNTKNLEEP